MPRPTVPAVTETWYAELATAEPGDETRGWPFLIFLGGLGHAFGPLHDIVRDTDDGPGWSMLLDPARCPVWALPWLAQFAGVRLTAGLTEAEQRAQITSPPAFERGTPGAMVDAAKRHLTSTRLVTFLERVEGSAWRDIVITYAAQTPDPTATARDVLEQEVVGRKLIYRTDPGWSVGQFEAAFAGRTVLEFEDDYATVDGFETQMPGGHPAWWDAPVPFGSFGSREGRAYRRRF